MTKKRAFLIHFLVSLFLISLILAVVLAVWYPTPYFTVDGAQSILAILIGVDLVLGPLLTLIVYKPGKPSLTFDMSCIILVQLVALIYGVHVTYKRHPEFVVFAVDRFSTVSLEEIDLQRLEHPTLKETLWDGPTLTQAFFPKDKEERKNLMFNVIFEGAPDIEFWPHLYQPYQPDMVTFNPRSIDIQQIMQLSGSAKEKINAFLAKNNAGVNDFFFLPLVGKSTDIVIVLSKQDGMPMGYIDINPWGDTYEGYERPSTDKASSKS